MVSKNLEKFRRMEERRNKLPGSGDELPWPASGGTFIEAVGAVVVTKVSLLVSSVRRTFHNLELKMEFLATKDI